LAFIIIICLVILSVFAMVFYHRGNRYEVIGGFTKCSSPLVVFDFDGTLCDSFKFVLEGLELVAQRNGLAPLTESEKEELKGMTSTELMKRFNIRWYHMPGLVKEMREQISLRISEMKAFEGVGPMLSTLKEKGASIGILTTNSAENAQNFLALHGLDSHFDFIYGGGSMFGKSKHLSKILRKTDLNPKTDTALYVGDETRDIVAALESGFNPVSVSWGFNSVENLEKAQGKKVITDWSELYSYL